MYIGVIGSSSCSPEAYEDARKIGRLIASEGHVLVCGGMGGIMEGASKGASEGGGVVVGILPGLNRSEANPYITLPIVTGLGHMRNMLVPVNSDVVIAIEGGWGTLSEIAFCKIHGIPVIGYKLSERISKIENIYTVQTPEEAIKLASLIVKGDA